MGEEYGLDGDVLGDLLGDATVGAGLTPALARGVLASQAKRGAALARMMPRTPQWRQRMAPGVPAPGVGLVPLPLQPSANGGVFTSAVNSIDFEGRPQKPFRGERLIALIGRSAGVPTSTRALTTGIFVGTDPQQAQIANIDLEVFAPTSFGVRLNMVQAEPGVLIRLPCLPSAAIAMGESFSITLMILGHYVR